MFYLTTHSTHFIYSYKASDIWLRTILIVRKETRCRHIGYSYRLTARVLLYAPSHRQDNTYHSLCYTSRGALAGTRNSSMGPPHEGSIRRPIAPRTNDLPLNYVQLLYIVLWCYLLHISESDEAINWVCWHGQNCGGESTVIERGHGGDDSTRTKLRQHYRRPFDMSARLRFKARSPRFKVWWRYNNLGSLKL